MEREGEGVAKSESPDGAAASGRGVCEGVVRGDGAVGVEPEHLAEVAFERLRDGALRVLADGDVELAVGAEVHRAAVVYGRAAEVVQTEDESLAVWNGRVAVGRQAADAVVARRRQNCVVDVYEAVVREVRVEGDA